MAAKLATIYLEHVKKEDLFSKICEDYLTEKPLGQDRFEELRKELLENFNPKNPFEHLKLLQDLFSLVFLFQREASSIEELKNSLKKIQALTFSEKFQPTQSITSAIRHLLHLPVFPIVLNNFPTGSMLLEDSGMWKETEVPLPIYSCQTALLGLILGICQNNSKLLKKALDVALWHKNLIDHESLPFLAMWRSEKEYSEIETYLAYYLMFYACGSLAGQKEMLKLSQTLLSKIENVAQSESFPVFYVLLESWIEKLQKSDFTLPQISLLESFSGDENQSILDPFVGLVGYRGENMSSLFTLSGVNSGLGAIKCGEVSVRSFGPQFLPLSDSLNFGIYRTCKSKLEDVHLKVDPTSSEIKGWTRLCKSQNSECVPAPIWLEFSGRSKANKNYLDFSILGQQEGDKIALSFYMKAESCLIDEKEAFYPCTLKRYLGGVKPIKFMGRKKALFFRSNMDQKMHVIPLAGRDFFWNTDFILAYEVSHENPQIHIEIEVETR